MEKQIRVGKDGVSRKESFVFSDGVTIKQLNVKQGGGTMAVRLGGFCY